LGLCGGEGVHILADGTVVLVGPLDDHERRGERGVGVGGEGHPLDSDIELSSGLGDVA
jgi:hypothetical protein